jgi:FlaA1/EpsC-like NDP-sugar epimerase
VIGTFTVANAARRAGVSRFLMISSDKAVNPTSVMGVTKRCAEVILSSMSTSDSTTFVSVRFGNVLGSKGSVVPIFGRQIALGGPVTVTHPDMRRYFMTIPEAVQLVLQAETIGKGSEVFVLDMGKPVRIVDLAKSLIRAAGFVPDVDIKIQFTGLRPGEKLFEEVQLAGEDICPTVHEKIMVFRGAVRTQKEIAQWLGSLVKLLQDREVSTVMDHLRLLVPEYITPEATPLPVASSVAPVKQARSAAASAA